MNRPSFYTAPRAKTVNLIPEGFIASTIPIDSGSSGSGGGDVDESDKSARRHSIWDEAPATNVWGAEE